MTVILFIASGFFTGLGFLFWYLTEQVEWLISCSIGASAIACVYALLTIISIFLWGVERRRRKAQLWHKRYVDLTAAQNTQKIILEIPREGKGSYDYRPEKIVGKYVNKGKRRNGKR